MNESVQTMCSAFAGAERLLKSRAIPPCKREVDLVPGSGIDLSYFMKPIARLSLLFAGLVTSAGAAPKNILFIAVDDLKPVIGAYGDTTAKTPNIDRLASRGLLFESAYTNQALCSPSRNALFTGIRPGTLGIYDLDTNFRNAVPDAVTFPQQLIRHGYRTESVGKLFHIGHGNHDDGKSWSVPPLRPSAPAYALPESQLKRKKDAQGRERGAAYESADVADDFYADGRIADEVVARLEAAKGRPDTPFFIGAGFLKPHLPFVAPKRYWDLYDPSRLQLAEFRKGPEGAPEAALRKNGELSSYKNREDADSLSDESQRKLLHGYYAAVSYTDAQIGRLLDALDRLGLAEDTIIVLWGDHGWHLGDHGLWAKMTNFEQATRIPFIISAPGVTKPGTKTKALVQTVDIYPTLLELTGVGLPDTPVKPEGASLVPLLEDPSVTVHDSVLQVVPRQGLIGRSVRTATHRLVEWKKPGAGADTAGYELYDYAADPQERKNLVNDQPEAAAKLKAVLAAYPEARPQITAKPAAETATGETGKKNARQDREKLFSGRDKDADGKLTREEFLANQKDAEAAASRWTRSDKNSDGTLSREEFVGAGK